jgi:tetratricopeptide (TPR) repeat protein
MPQTNNVRKKMTRKDTRDLETKIAFLEGLIRRDANYVEALQLLGDYYTQRGQLEDGLKIDERLSRLEPRNPLVFYNLACSYSLTGDIDRSAGALDRALSLGYRDFKWLARDPDLRTLRKHPLFRNIEETIRKMTVTMI